MRMLYITALIILVAGCVNHPVAYPKYKNFESEMSAKVRVVSTSQVTVFVSKGEKCDKESYIASVNSGYIDHNRKNIGLPLGSEFSDEQKTEFSIAPGEISTLHFILEQDRFASHVRCVMSLAFSPKESSIYEASFDIQGAQCVVGLTKIDKNAAGEYLRVPEKNVRPFHCKW